MFDWVLVWETDGLNGTNVVKTTHIAQPRSPKTGDELDSWLFWVQTKDRPPDAIGTPIRINLAALPEGKRFSTAWRVDRANNRVALDLPEMRVVILEEVRRERSKRLDESDKEKNRLDDEGTAQQKQAYKDYRKALRDLPAIVTSQVAALATPEALLAYQPMFPAASQS